MYRLVVIEDEEIIRDGIISIINWNSIGFEVVEDFEDGKEAIEYFKSNTVDVVLTDIKMSNVSGLEVCAYLKENSPNTKLVILSGYKQFDYAQKSIQYDVKEYLTKPIDFEKLTSIFEKIKDELEIEKNEKNKRRLEKKKKLELQPLIEEQLFMDIRIGALSSKNDLINRFKMLDIDIDVEFHSVINVTISLIDIEEYLEKKWNYGKDRLKRAIYQIVRKNSERAKLFPIIRFTEPLEIVGVFDCEYESDFLMNEMMNYIEEIKTMLKSLLEIEIEITKKNTYKNILDFSKKRYQEIEKDFNAIYSAKDKIDCFTSKNKESMITFLNENKIEESKNLFKHFIDALEKFEFKDMYYESLDLISWVMKELDVYKRKNQYLGESNQTFDLIYSKDKKNLKEFSLDCFNRIMLDEMKDITYSSNHIIEIAKKYIMTNYSKDISLDDVASKVYLSSVYFSQVFKDQTGINYSDYLLEVRMTKARELLGNSDNKILDIAKKVGYHSGKYFSATFKKYYGYTPTQYHLRVMEDDV